MTKDDKLKFLKSLDDKGAFLISKSGERVCKYLGISKFTLYNYLETVRKNGKREDVEAGMAPKESDSRDRTGS